MAGEALTDTELDERCEKWLADTFNLKIDFGISDAVEPLLQNGLIIQDMEVQYPFHPFSSPTGLSGSLLNVRVPPHNPWHFMESPLFSGAYGFFQL